VAQSKTSYSKNLADAAARQSIVARISAVQPDSARLWGKMTAHQMLCHLTDSYRSVIGERQVSPYKHWIPRPILRWLVLKAFSQWPRNTPTRPENQQGAGGTPPADFESDRTRLLAALERFCSAPDSARGSHPVLGALTYNEWMNWGYRHADHHLRQFGV
jgi:hypothetical protein